MSASHFQAQHSGGGHSFSQVVREPDGYDDDEYEEDYDDYESGMCVRNINSGMCIKNMTRYIYVSIGCWSHKYHRVCGVSASMTNMTMTNIKRILTITNQVDYYYY
jgi:hypothetical protein